MNTSKFLPYEEAEKFVHSLKLRNYSQFLKLVREKNIPYNIPTNPKITYFGKGWVSCVQWIGSTYNRKWKNYLPYNQARDYVHSLKLKTMKEFRYLAKQKKLPDNIPSNPYNYYTGKGWVNAAEWIGSSYSHIICGSKVNKNTCLSYQEAKQHLATIKLHSMREYFIYYKNYNKNKKNKMKLPSCPYAFYGEEWVNWVDFLSKKNKHKPEGFMSYKEAKKFLKPFKLKSWVDWYKFRSSNKRPQNLPSTPERFYLDNGWVSMQDFLSI